MEVISHKLIQEHIKQAHPQLTVEDGYHTIFITIGTCHTGRGPWSDYGNTSPWIELIWGWLIKGDDRSPAKPVAWCLTFHNTGPLAGRARTWPSGSPNHSLPHLADPDFFPILDKILKQWQWQSQHS